MEPVMMRSAVIAMMVAALMILRTAAYPGITSEPPTTSDLELPTTSGPPTTSELPTTSEPPTTSELPTTTEPPTTTTTSCQIVTCGPNCAFVTGTNGCPSCDCHPTCVDVTCDPNERCIMVDVQCNEPRCFPVPTCIRYDGLTTETSTPPPPPCPDQSWCTGDCQLDYSSEGCPNCICPDSFCQVVTCVSSEECNQNYECYYGRCYSCMYIGPPTPSTRPTTPCLMVTCGYNCGYATGEDGCQMCDCHPTCMDETCDPNERCIMIDVQCNEPRCFPVPTCMRYDGPVRPTTETSTWAPTTSPCSDTWCGDGPFCFPDNSSGVCGCICVDPKCMMEGCPYEGQECLPTGECRACYECFPKYDDTTTPPPTPTPTTSPCSDMWCGDDPLCFPDNSSGFCACLCFDPKCMLEGCPDGQQCLPTGECPTCYECLPEFDPCTGTPNPDRCGRGSKTRWTYNSQNDTCESFRYYGCTPSPNTFRSRKECRNKCSGNSQIVCPTFVCDDDCYTLERKDECPLCICPNPCKEFKCRKGYECKMRESKCKKGAKPFCAKSPCPPQDPCGKRCMYGLKTDKNGCQLCECLEEPTP